MPITLEVPVPRSVNARRKNWRAAHRLKQAEQRDLGLLLLAAKVPRPIPGDRVHAIALVRHPVARRRDEGNFRAPLEKALGDALQVGGHLTDDTPAHFTFGAVHFAVDRSRSQSYCELTLYFGDDLGAVELPAPGDVPRLPQSIFNLERGGDAA